MSSLVPWRRAQPAAWGLAHQKPSRLLNDLNLHLCIQAWYVCQSEPINTFASSGHSSPDNKLGLFRVCDLKSSNLCVCVCVCVCGWVWDRPYPRQPKKLRQQGVLCHHGTMGSYGSTRRSPWTQRRRLQVRSGHADGSHILSIHLPNSF